MSPQLVLTIIGALPEQVDKVSDSNSQIWKYKQ